MIKELWQNVQQVRHAWQQVHQATNELSQAMNQVTPVMRAINQRVEQYHHHVATIEQRLKSSK